jgi:P-type Cu2+ transporter
VELVGPGHRPERGGEAPDSLRQHPAAARPQSLWLAGPTLTPVRFEFADDVRPDIAVAIERLQCMGLQHRDLLGRRRPDRSATWHGAMWLGKVGHLEQLRGAGKQAVMVGDGLNDAPAAASAHVSIAPATGTEVTQSAADIVFQGAALAAIPEALAPAHKADRLMRQNLATALLYNLAAVPLAVVRPVRRR